MKRIERILMRKMKMNYYCCRNPRLNFGLRKNLRMNLMWKNHPRELG